MPEYLASLAPQELKEFMQRLEKQSDGCFEKLSIYDYPRNVSVWSVLSHSVQHIEKTAVTHGYGSQRQREVMINLARASALVIEWIQTRGTPAVKIKSALRLTHELQGAAETAIQTAHNYLSFVMNFSLWHRDGVLAEAMGPNRVRFSNVGGPQQRRVRAYQQGVRPFGVPATIDNPAPSPISDSRISTEILRVLERSQKKGTFRFSYVPPFQAYRDLTELYSERLVGLFRRDLALSLGQFDLEDFRRFYAALLGICALHENICFLWLQKHGKYPVDSAVLVRRMREWVSLIAGLSGLTEQKTGIILQSLTASAGGTSPVDLHVHPFVSAEDPAHTLYLVPHYPMHARPDENALRVCSYLTPQAYDATSALKERETIDDLMSIQTRFKLDGPLSLPDGLPDIDLLVQDSDSRSVAVVELKWIRKTLRAVEHIRADEQLTVGLQQLKEIRAFLSANPDHLSRRGILSFVPDLSDDMHFLLVARDHFRWVEATEGIVLVAYDPFKMILQDASDLRTGIGSLKTLDWLPVEGRDFTVRHEPATANAVTIEAEVFHRT